MLTPPIKAIHEASHAVGVLHTGCNLQSIEIVKATDSPLATGGSNRSVGRTCWRSAPLGAERNWDAELKVAFAGPVAEAKLALENTVQLFDSDYMYLCQAIDGLFGSGTSARHTEHVDSLVPYDEWTRCNDSSCKACPCLDATLYIVNHEIVTPCWNVINKIARKLARVRYMEGWEVAAIYDEAAAKGEVPVRPPTIPQLLKMPKIT